MSVWLRRNWPLLAVIALVVLAAVPVLTYPLGRDQGEFATIGRGLLQGKTPYVDLWNPKPPAVFVVYALALRLFGQTAAAVRAIDLLLLPVLLACAYALGRRLASEPRRSIRCGWLAALILGVFYSTETFWTLSQNDGIALVPMMLALICAFHAAESETRGRLWALLCGLLCAVAIWFKYPFALFCIAPVGAYWLYGRRIRLWDAFSYVAGLAIGIGAGLVALAAAGALAALIESARTTSSYTALGLNWADFSAALRVAMGYRWSQWGLLFVLALVGVIVIWIHARRIRRSETPEEAKRAANRAGWAMIVWLLAGTAAMVIQAKAYDYHWLPMLPPLALLAAVGIDGVLARLGDSVGRRAERWIAIGIGALLAAGLIGVVWGRAWPLLTGQIDQQAYYRQFQAGEFIASESQAVADYLHQRVLPGDSLYIWGFRPEIYLLSELNPPTRFIFQFPLVAGWYPPEWRQENVDILWAALPPYVIVAEADYMPWVTGSHDDSNTLLQSYEELNDWLIYNYEPETQIGGLYLWKRKT